MKIAIVGTGTMAGGFARGLKDKHEVWLGSRDAERGKRAADETGATGGGSYTDVVSSVLLAGDDPATKETVSQIARDMGFDPVDVGELSATSHLERLLANIGGLGLGPDSSLKVLQHS